MIQTNNYGLNKPTILDKVDVNHLNENADIIDGALKSIEDKLNPLKDKLDGINMDTKVDKDGDKQLSDNNYTNEDKQKVDKVDGIEDDLAAHKEEYVQYKDNNNLKIAKVEKGLNDYQSTMATMNPNQEVKQKATGYGTISLPKNTANGQVSVSVKGQTYTNILGTHENKNSMLTQPVGANIYFAQNGGVGNTVDSKLIKLIGGNRYLVKIDFLNPTTNNLSYLRAYNGSVITEGTLLGSLVANGLSSYVVFTAPDTDTIRLAFRNNVADSNYYHDKSIIVDLTAIGETETDINKLIQKYPYVSNTKSTISASRLKSVDKDGIQESTQYLPNVGELRSVPNGIRDEVRVIQNKAELVKRTKDYVLQENDIRYVHHFNNVSSILSIEGFPFDGNEVVPSNITSNLIFVKYEDIDNVGNIGKYTIVDNRLYFILEKGITQAQARVQLVNKVTLTYELSEPIITPINVSGNLISYPSGTVYVENIVADAGIYTTKFDIKELQLPIKNIDKLIKYNFTTGVQTVLDTSLAVINEDKKSFTHPNLAKDDMVFVDYFYDVESTLGETTIEYLDSRHTIKDSVNNKFYKWDIKSTNGVPTVELTEVL